MVMQVKGKWLWSRDDGTNKNTESTKNDEGINALWVVLGLALGTIIAIGIGFNWLVSLTIGVLTLTAVTVGASIPIVAFIRRRKYRESIKSIEKERDRIRQEREDAEDNNTISLNVPAGESPIALLRTAIMNGDASAASLARAYTQLEDMMTENDIPLDVTRSKYSPRFSGLAQLLALRDDVRTKPRLYGISTAQMDAMISDAEAALADDMASDARAITDQRVISARATADYIVNADVDRKHGVDHLTALTSPSITHPAPVSTSGDSTVSTVNSAVTASLPD